MTSRIVAVTFVFSAMAWGSACSLPVASRRAQVLEPGEVEASAGASGGVLFSQATAATFASSYVPALGTNASVRFGIVPRIDLQLRLLDVLVPEISAGWQLVGDPAANEFALTLTGGAGPVFGLGFSNAAGAFSQLGVFIPLQLLIDVPVGDGALTFGARAIGAGSRIDANGTASYVFTFTPGVTASWTLPFGTSGFFARPELVASVPLFGAAPVGDGAIVMGTLAFGYEFQVDAD